MVYLPEREIGGKGEEEFKVYPAGCASGPHLLYMRVIFAMVSQYRIEGLL
jgi:hypothetical protein